MISQGATRCQVCSVALRGRQRKYCSKQCATSFGALGARQALRRLTRKTRLVRLLGGHCTHCGFAGHPCALSFHHRDPALKRFALESNQLSSRRWSEILQEAKKCTLLCLNCHAILHWARKVPSSAVELPALSESERSGRKRVRSCPENVG